MVLYHGTTFRGAEEHRRVEVMSQGTTLVVPKGKSRVVGFVSGHDFSRAERAAKIAGFSP
jgi:hypothetical protein